MTHAVTVLQEDITKYLAVSETALQEQVAKLTETVSQQATAINHLSASIALLSAARNNTELSSASTSSTGNRHNGANSFQAPRKRKRSESSRVPNLPAINKSPSAGNQPLLKRLAAPGVNGRAREDGVSKPRKEVMKMAKQGEADGSGETGSMDEGVEETFLAVANLVEPSDATKAQSAKDTLVSQLYSLKDHTSVEERLNVVRARLCSDWIAIRPEELLARLRSFGYVDVPTRKEWMEMVAHIGPGIVRGRSVKFGRDTRRALAIPRMYFDAKELNIIDKGFLREFATQAATSDVTSDTAAADEEEEEVEEEEDEGLNEED